MPTVRIYVREKAYAKLMSECRHDRGQARKKIAELVHAKYA